MLTSQGVFETTDLNRSMPNLQVSSPYGTSQPNFSIRGVGVGTEFNANAASPIGVYVDEVYQTFRSSHGQQFFDLERLEVVRGPQGTLYGRNTTGGAINIITRQPELQGTNGYVTAGYGNYERTNFEGAVEFTPITDVLGIRLAGTYVNSDSYVENLWPTGGRDPGGHENYGFRGIVRYVPNEAVDLSLKIYATRSEGGLEIPFSQGQDGYNVNFSQSAVGGLYQIPGLDALLPPMIYNPQERGLDDLEVEADKGGDAINDAEGIVLTGKFDLSDSVNLTTITGYDEGEYAQLPNTDCDGTPYDFCSIGYQSKFRAFNQDVRINYDADRFNLIVGGYYGYDSITARNRPDFFNFLEPIVAALGFPDDYFDPGGAFGGFPSGIRGTQNNKQERRSLAFYTEGKYDVTDTVAVTLGLRWTKDKFAYLDGLTTYFDYTGAPRMFPVSNYAPGGVEQAYIIGLSPGPLPGGLERYGDSEEVSGRLIVDWKPTDNMMLYASYSRGYRGGTFNGLSYTTASQVYFVEPEFVDAYEAGFKTRWLDDHLQLNGAVFYYDYEQQQGQVVDQTATANLISLDGEIKGLELEAKYIATDSLRINASVGVLDSEYDDTGNCPETPVLTGYPPQQGSCLASGAGNINVGGNEFPFAAELTFNTSVEWDVADTSLGMLTWYFDANYTGEFNYDSFGNYDYVNGSTNSRNLAPGVFHEGEGEYWISNSRLTLASQDYDISLWIKNISDKTYYPYGINLETLFGNSYRVRAQPRTYGLEVKYRF